MSIALREGLARSATVAAAVFVCGALAAVALRPIRAERAQAASTGAIEGRVVVDAPAAPPIAAATVTLAGIGLPVNRTTTSDEDGRFMFDGLPSGNFTVSASKPPYLSRTYGQTATSDLGVPITVRPGQRIGNLVLPLPPGGAVITGRLVDAVGRPVAHAPVIALEYRIVDGVRTLWSHGVQSPSTDSRGMYRLYGLPPGTYLVGAYAPGDYNWFPGASAGPVPPPGGAAGDVARLTTSAEVQWALSQVAQSASAARPGSAPLATSPPRPSRSVALGSTFYPGTSDPAEAVAVTVGAGQERAGVDFVMKTSPAAHVTGRVVGPDGNLATGARVTLGGGGTSMSSVAANGTFSYYLLAGQYTLSATVSGTAFPAVTIDVTGEDITDLVLGLQPALSTMLAGRVVFEMDGAAPAVNVRPVRLTARPLQAGVVSLPVTAAADGTFQFPNLAPGRYRLFASAVDPAPAAPAPSGPPWVMKSALINGVDVADVPYEVRAGDSATSVVVTMTTRTTELSGTIADASGRPAAGHFIVVFSTDRQFWVSGSRRMPRPQRSSTTGEFSFAGLPAGGYCVALVPMLDPAVTGDEAFLARLMADALVVTLTDGERKRIALTAPR